MIKKFFSVLLTLTIIFSLFSAETFAIDGPAAASATTAATAPAYQTAMNSALWWILSRTNSPIVGSIGGEWAVLARARAGLESADSPWTQIYLAALDAELADGSSEALSKKMDWERVVLAVSALGLDASDYKGRDLTARFKTYAAGGTVNADIFALIALDAKGYIGDSAQYVNRILSLQIPDGSWSLSNAPPGDADITAMAVQALAPYYSGSASVKTAVDKAIAWLNAQTITDAEGNAQIIVALSALGRDAVSYVNALLTYRDEAGGGFKRGGSVNAMTTEQAAYALTAYDRARNNQNSLYNMRDADGQPGESSGEAGEAISAAKILIESAVYTAAQAEISNESATLARINTIISGLALNGVTAVAVKESYTAAIAGTADDTGGANGSYDFTVQLNKGAGTQQTTRRLTLTIAAAPYMPPVGNTTVTVSVEKFTVNGEYIIEPTQMTIPQGVSAAYAVSELLKAQYPGVNNPYYITGNIASGFYLRRVYDPTYGGTSAANAETRAGYLSEFDEGSLSGWKFCVNNSFPGLGADVIILQDGDVMRWQYSKTGDFPSDEDISAPAQPANKDGLTAKIAEIRAEETQSSYGASYESALAVLKTLPSTQAQVDAALSALDPDALPDLVDKSELLAAINSASSLQETDYTPESWAAFDAALTEARRVYDDNDAAQEQADAAKMALTDAIMALLPLEIIDSGVSDAINALQAEISKVHALAAADYTPESWADVESAVMAAQDAIDDAQNAADGDDEAEILPWLATAKDGLTSAIESLVPYAPPAPADKTALNAAIAAARAKVQPQYTPASWDAMQNMLAAALDARNNPDTVQDEVDTALTNLTNAIDALVPKPVDVTVTYQTAMNSALSWILSHTSSPVVGTIGGEWAVLARARAGLESADSPWTRIYLAALDAELADESSDALSKKTDWERVVLAVSALGLDTSNYKGRDLTARFRTYAAEGTVNADIFALIALDAKGYAGDAAAYLNRILSLQISDGSWSLSNTAPGDADVTAMAIQALAPYYSGGTNIKTAVDKAIVWLNAQTIADVEGNVQIIVALSALGLDAASYVNALLTYYDEASGGFKRGGFVNAMSTEQGAYALTAYERYRSHQNSLYNMRDAGTQSAQPDSDDAAAVNAAASSLTWYVIRNANADENVITSALNLPAFGENGVTIRWSSNSSHISHTGSVSRPPYISGDQSVTLTADLTKGSAAKTVTFDLTVLALSQNAASISIHFRLVGDEKHTTPDKHKDYSDWIPMTTLDFENAEEVSVYEVFMKAVSDYGLRQVGAGGNYVSSINGLAEFTNGPNSGWMYMINGVHVDRGLQEWFVTNGDTVVWHYVDDHIKEETAWERVFPYGIPDGLGDGDSDSDDPDGSEETVIVSSTEVTVTVINGKASAVIDSDEINAALVKSLEDITNAEAEGEENVTGEIKYQIKGDEGAASVAVDFRAGDLRTIAAEANVVLTIECGIAAMTLDSATLAGLVTGAADDAIIRITSESVAQSQLSSAQNAVVRGDPAFDLKILVGERVVDAFQGVITVFLPYKPSGGIDPESRTVCYLTEDDSAKAMDDVAYNARRSGFIFLTDHFSLFYIAEAPEEQPEETPQEEEAPQDEEMPRDDGWVNPYTDVSETDWHYNAVCYATEKGFMSGVGGGLFAPDTFMSRAMLITVLYRLAGSPAVTEESPFVDVEDSGWYANAVGWGCQEGIVAGYGNGLFGTNDDVTREQMITILYNYAAKTGLDINTAAELIAYSDAGQISGYALNAMQWARGLEIITGRGATILAPQGTSTRAEVAQLLMGFMETFLESQRRLEIG
ncbi:MAG: S-layer homology domain-containing protein [Clostridiales bacterium]|jgi:hypothetical protein|nr:S-layer homology domain-containing protein [Clostridiales bacterium]